MIKSPEYKKKADAFIKPIYAATVLGQIEWADAITYFYTKEDFDGFSFQIGDGVFYFIDLVAKGDKPSLVLSFEYGEYGEKLVEYLQGKREKAHLEKLAAALESMTKAVEAISQNRKEVQA